MHIEKVKNGYRAHVQIAGKRRSVTRPTEMEVIMAAAALTLELGGKRQSSSVTVEQMIVAWLEVTTHAPTYRTDVLAVIDLMPAHFTSRTVADVDTDLIDALYRGIAAARGAHRARRAHAILSPAFSMATRYRWATRNPCTDAMLPELDPRDIFVPEASMVRKLIGSVAGKPLRILVPLAAVTGCRRGELIGLQWDDFQGSSIVVRRSVAYTPDEGLHIRPTKTGSKGHRVLALDPATVQMLTLEHAKQRTDAMARGSGKPTWMFSHDGPTPWRPDYVTLEFTRARDRIDAGEMNLHSLRHFMATQLLAAGVPVSEVAGRLGHTNIQTVIRTYRHYLPAADQISAATIARILASAGES